MLSQVTVQPPHAAPSPHGSLLPARPSQLHAFSSHNPHGHSCRQHNARLHPPCHAPSHGVPARHLRGQSQPVRQLWRQGSPVRWRSQSLSPPALPAARPTSCSPCTSYQALRAAAAPALHHATPPYLGTAARAGPPPATQAARRWSGGPCSWGVRKVAGNGVALPRVPTVAQGPQGLTASCARWWWAAAASAGRRGPPR